MVNPFNVLYLWLESNLQIIFHISQKNVSVSAISNPSKTSLYITILSVLHSTTQHSHISGTSKALRREDVLKIIFLVFSSVLRVYLYCPHFRVSLIKGSSVYILLPHHLPKRSKFSLSLCLHYLPQQNLIIY